MKRKLFASLLVLTLMLSVTSCDKPSITGNISDTTNSTVASDEVASVTFGEKDDNPTVSSADNAVGSIAEQIVSKPTTQPSQGGSSSGKNNTTTSQPAAPISSQGTATLVETKPSSSPDAEKAPEPVKPIVSSTPTVSSQTQQKPSSVAGQQPQQPASHTPLSSANYYGYKQLSASEKKLYAKIDDAVYTLTNEVVFTNTDWDSIVKTFGYYTADHPQCFWLSGTIQGSMYGDEITLFLFYSDGTTSDVYDSKKGWTTTANRDKIIKQVGDYQKKLAEVLGQISSSMSAFEMEKAIHDFVLKQVVYPNPIPNNNPSIYTAYGALINGSAVCEGYAKLFQHLCYEVGINCIQVSGVGTTESGQEAHMWNTVQLDGAWYQVDVTWDDSYRNNEILSYEYFNITDAEMFADHTIQKSGSIPTYTAPKCTATTYNYYKNYCVNVNKNGALSANAADRIRQALNRSDDKLYIVFPNGIPKNANDYIYGKHNSVSTILKSVNSSRSLDTRYSILGNRYILIKIQ